MWEQLNVPIVPLVFYGAYELYPASSWVNNTGKDNDLQHECIA